MVSGKKEFLEISTKLNSHLLVLKCSGGQNSIEGVVQEEKFVEISTPTFFPVFTGNLREKLKTRKTLLEYGIDRNLREKRNFLRFLQISPLVQCLP